MNLQAAADLLGVHYQTAYRWVRTGTLLATKVGSTYTVSDEELARFQAVRRTPALPPERLQVRDWPAQAERFTTALCAGDELEARDLLNRLVEGLVPIREICSMVIAPSLCQIGEMWSKGMLSIPVEHRATTICDRLISRIAPSPRGRPRGTAVAVVPEGELHLIPSYLAAVTLREDRWRVHQLGSGLPTESLIEFLHNLQPDLVVVTPVVTAEAGAVLADQLRLEGFRVLTPGPKSDLDELVRLARDLAPEESGAE